MATDYIESEGVKDIVGVKLLGVDSQSVDSATLTEQQAQTTELTAIKTSLVHYETQQVDEVSAAFTYVGKLTAAGAWRIDKIAVSGTVTTITHATVLNNALVTTYSAAWTDRASLTYGTYAEAF